MENISQIQVVAVTVSLLLFLFIMYLIRSQRLKEEYSLLWIFFSVVFIVFSFWRSGLDYISQFLGVAYPPAALFMILLMAIFLILIEFSVIISRLSDKNKALAQEIGLLKFRMKNMERKLKDKKKKSSGTEMKPENDERTDTEENDQN
ncbi:MAG TPA: DUF2304 domain-containing protein [Bacteroidales bacterium]|nr:DUF2304 domain-containing protein [Bacteroidales bacterium]